MSSNLFLPSSQNRGIQKTFQPMSLVSGLQLHFDSLLLHISLPLFFRLDSISLRNKGIVQHGDIWVNLVRWTNQLVYTYTHTRVYMYHKLLLLYRYEISTLDVSNFFFLLRVFVVILSWSLQTSFHSRNLLSCFWVEPVKFIFFLPFFGRIICKTDLGWKD